MLLFGLYQLLVRFAVSQALLNGIYILNSTFVVSDILRGAFEKAAVLIAGVLIKNLLRYSFAGLLTSLRLLQVEFFRFFVSSKCLTILLYYSV